MEQITDRVVLSFLLQGIDKIDFPRSISRNASSLIKKLCRENPAERLGYQRGGVEEIKRHRWFDGFYWEGLINRRITAPIIPTVSPLSCFFPLASCGKSADQLP